MARRCSAVRTDAIGQSDLVTKVETYINGKVTAVGGAFLPRGCARKIVAALAPPPNAILQML
jgi:hypothetical protein